MFLLFKKMKVFTHNLLTCNSKSCSLRYPLKIIPIKINKVETEFNDELTKRFIKKVDFSGLASALKDLNLNSKYDFSSLTQEDYEKNDFLEELHHVLFEILVVDGILECNGCGIKYPVNNGIADFVTNEEK